MASLRKKSDSEPLRRLIGQSKSLRNLLLSLPHYHSFYPKQAPCLVDFVDELKSLDEPFVQCQMLDGRPNTLVSSPTDPCLSNSPRLFSSELTETGIRRYLLTSYSRFLIHYHSLSSHARHYYELIPQGKSVRVHMDVERRLGVGRGRNRDKRGEGDIVKVLRGEFWRYLVAEFGDDVVPPGLTATQILSSPDTPEVTSVLSSLTVHLTASTLKKFSCHLIFHIPGCLWVDNENMGGFVKAFVEQWNDTKKSSALLNLSSPTPLTQKRLSTALSFTSYALCFERTLVVPLSTSGCSTVLRWNSSGSSSDAHNPKSEVARMETLVKSQVSTYAPPPVPNPPQPPGSSTLPPTSAVDYSSLPASLPFDAASHAGKQNLRLPSCYPILDAYVGGYLCTLHADPHLGVSPGVIGGWSATKVSGAGQSPWVSRLTYDIRGNRWCGNVGRHHRSNNIRFQVDLMGGIEDLGNGGAVWRQMCHDRDCRGYRSEWYEVEEQGVKEWEEGERWDRVCMMAVGGGEGGG
ncbi:hypothetical protein TrRE_jg7691, partial [Triparma retinervis]